MNRLFLIFAVLLTWQSFASPLVWVVGEDYIARWKENQPLETFPMQNTSWTLNQKTCDLWVTNEKETLRLISPKAPAPSPFPGHGKILSKTFESSFYTKNAKNVLEERDSQGRVKMFHGAIPPLAHSFARGPATSFLLEYSMEQNLLNLVTYDAKMALEKTTSLAPGATLWSTPKMTFDSSERNVWIGYTAQTAQHMYSPVVELRGKNGQLKQSQSWNARGLLLDQCLEKNGSLTVARDLPSPNFTVPLYSFLENLEENASPVQIYEAEVNLLIDSVACREDGIYMAQRSLFTSEGSHLQRWNRKTGDKGQTLTKLPGQAWKIYVCDVD